MTGPLDGCFCHVRPAADQLFDVWLTVTGTLGVAPPADHSDSTACTSLAPLGTACTANAR